MSAVASRWPAWSMLAGTCPVAALVGYSLLRYPHTLDDPVAPAYIVLLSGLLATYLGLAGWALRRVRPGSSAGTLVGVLAAVAWSVEIWAGGPSNLDGRLESIVGGSFALLAVAITLAAGVLAGARERGARVLASARARDARVLAGRGVATAMWAGLFAGLASGIGVFCFAVAMTLTNLGILGARADYQRQFATGHSHAPDMATFLVGDGLAAGTAHLVINLVLGLIGGGLGALVSNALGAASQPAGGTRPS